MLSDSTLYVHIEIQTKVQEIVSYKSTVKVSKYKSGTYCLSHNFFFPKVKYILVYIFPLFNIIHTEKI